MNTVECTVIEVVNQPYQKIDENDCCWCVDIVFDCYGTKQRKTFKKTSKQEIEQIKIGYSWNE